MNTERKNFIMLDEDFVCENCGKKSPKSGKSCRNHCGYCLYSMHVDEKIPGDRKSECKGLMKAVCAVFDSRKKYILVHECLKCGKISANKIEEDDNMELIGKLINANPKQAGNYEKNRRKRKN